MERESDMKSLTDTEGQVALVTGANKGLGREVVRELVRKGMIVYLGSRDIDRGKQAAEELAQEGLPVTVVELDVTDRASVKGALLSKSPKIMGALMFSLTMPEFTLARPRSRSLSRRCERPMKQMCSVS
jgi:hypothetical protein